MRKIAVMNQKGGVGKTTTSVNLAAGLALQGKRVCLIDLDPQAHASLHLGIEIVGDTPTVYQAFAGEKTLAQVRRLVAPQLWLVPSNIDLAAAEVELADTPGRELILRDTVEQLLATEPYDYLILDCPPSLGVLTLNALSAAEEVFIPLQPHFLALHGLSKLLETTALVTRRLNRKLRVSGIVLCMHESNTRLAADVAADLQDFLSASDAEAPWARAIIFTSKIRRNIKLAEAPGYGKSIYEYAPKCPGAIDYQALVGEVLAMERAATASVPLARAGEFEVARALSQLKILSCRVLSPFAPRKMRGFRRAKGDVHGRADGPPEPPLRIQPPVTAPLENMWPKSTGCPSGRPMSDGRTLASPPDGF